MLSYFEVIDDNAAIDKLRMEKSRPAQITQWNDLSLPTFWIDALCINQNDLVERSKQVKRMDHIYRQTYLLLIWGLNHQQTQCSKEDAEDFFRYTEFLCKVLERLTFQTSSITYESNITNVVRKAFTIQQFRINTLTTAAAAGVFGLEWFCRAWVFQEVALSASKPSEFWMGFKHISLPRLLVAGTAALQVSAELDPQKAIISRMCVIKVRRALRALGMDKSLVVFGQNSLHSVHPTSNLHICRRLIYLLSDGHLYSKMTDPRDAIYSLYGLLSASRLPAVIDPDYTKSVSVVYHSVASFLLSNMGIDILGFLLSSWDGTGDCPSWVPDFSRLQRYDTLCQQYPSVGTTYKHRQVFDSR
jgi:hypothetical protein